jgi:hypothetical protein
MSKIKFNLSRFIACTAEVLADLPAVGSLHHGRRVLALSPAPLRAPQRDPAAYAWAVWRLRLAGKIAPVYVAVHEPESDVF